MNAPQPPKQPNRRRPRQPNGPQPQRQGHPPQQQKQQPRSARRQSASHIQQPVQPQPRPKHDPNKLLEHVRRMLKKGMPPKELHQKLVDKHQVPPQQVRGVIKQVLAEIEDREELMDYAEELFAKGKSAAAVRRILIEKEGLSEEDAQQIAKELKPKKKKNQKKKSGSGSFFSAGDDSRSGYTNMALGGVICIIGLAVTIISFANAAHSGGRYVVAWGAVVFGAVQFFRGIIQLSR